MNSIRSLRGQAFKTLRRQRGASLLEGIAYLGIAAIVVLGAVSLLTGAFSSAQSNRVAEEVISIRTGVKKLFMGQSVGYGADGTDLLPVVIAAKVMPTTITVTGAGAAGVASNSWAGAVTIASVGGNKFSITYAAVPVDACINILSGASGWDSITAGGGVISVFPAAPSDVQTKCGTAAGNITWVSF